MANKTEYLPASVKTKIYKTGQTRGADDDVIYQNRVGRNSTVIIPYEEYEFVHKLLRTMGNMKMVILY